MRALVRALGLVVCALVGLHAPMARGAFHLWDIKEIFSSADGSVQFIEFVCGAASFEHFLANHPMTATSDGAVVNFMFTSNLNTQQSTANRHFLAATAGFAALPGGVAPDYTIPANFFNPNATSITINFSSGTDVVTFAGASLPKDGVMSLTDQSPAGATNLVASANSPTNFSGAAGSINVGGAPPRAGDFDEDGDVDGADLAAWQGGFGMQGAAVDHMDGDADEDSDVDGADFLIWQQELGTSDVASVLASVPEPATVGLAAVAALLVIRLPRQLAPRRSRAPAPWRRAARVEDRR